jgi:nicotinamidase-related amidase
MSDRHTEPQLEASAMITIDTQRDLLDGGPFPIPGTTAALPAMRRLLETFRTAGRPIIHVVRLYEQDGSDAERCRRELLASGAELVIRATAGSELAPDLLPEPDLRLDHELLMGGGIQRLGRREVAIYKPRWGAFYRTPLEAHLREHAISTLVFSGCNFPNCPRTSIYEASERDFRVVLARDAISGLYDRGEQELRGIGVVLMSADEVGDALRETVAV